MAYDFAVSDEGSIVVLSPLNDLAEEWINEHIPEDAPVWGAGIAIERNYFPAIEQGIYNDGLALEFV